MYFFSLQRAHAPVAIDVTIPPVTIASQDTIPATTIDPVFQMIEVTTPLQNTQIASPLVVTGRARGSWYFEASFPIELYDQNSTLIGQAIAQAQADWMTTDFVPFTATLTFPAQPTGSMGTLILKKDNPSGDPQNDLNLILPIQFQ